MIEKNLFITLNTVDSTNNYAMTMIRAGMAKHAMVIYTKQQTAGKGQRGKTWQMQAGKSIALSLIVNTHRLKADKQFCLSMQMALGVAQFLKKYCPKDIFLKWPNDVYCCDRKAGGILIENIFAGTQWQWAVIGVGLNINKINFDADLLNPISMEEITGIVYDVENLAKELPDFLIKNFDELFTKSTHQIIADYQTCLYKINEKVKLKKDNVVLETYIKGVNADGQLVTENAEERLFNFGEVEWIL